MTNLKYILLTIGLVSVCNLFGVACSEGSQIQQHDTAGIDDLRTMKLLKSGNGPGLTRVFEWRHLDSGKQFLSTRRDGYDLGAYRFAGDAGFIFSKMQPQPESTSALYLTFDEIGTPHMTGYLDALLIASKNSSKIEFLGYLQRANP